MSWYDPKDASTVAPEGWYPAIIVSSEMKQTKKGDPMEVVKFRVFGQQKTITLNDYFHPSNLWKLKKLAKALGQEDAFMQGTFEAAKFAGQPFEVELIIEDNADFGEQNKIAKFDSDRANTPGLPANANTSVQQPQGAAAGGYSEPETTGSINHDDIPF